MIEWEIEQHLVNQGCFTNGLNGKQAHPDSYMTVLEYDRVKPAVESASFTREQWEQAITYWEENSNCGIPLKLAAKEINRIIHK